MGGSERLHSLKLRVHGGTAGFGRSSFTLGDGTKEELPIRDRVRSGGKTHEFELPGDRRTIDSFELWYSKERLNECPDVVGERKQGTSCSSTAFGC